MAATKPVTPLSDFAGVQIAVGRFRVHADFQQRNQLPRLLIHQANFDHVELQQVLRAVQDVRLEQLDAVFDRHVEDFFGLQVGQLAAGVLNGGQLLLLLHFGRHVAERHDQVPRLVARDR